MAILATINTSMCRGNANKSACFSHINFKLRINRRLTSPGNQLEPFTDKDAADRYDRKIEPTETCFRRFLNGTLIFHDSIELEAWLTWLCNAQYAIAKMQLIADKGISFQQTGYC